MAPLCPSIEEQCLVYRNQKREALIGYVLGQEEGKRIIWDARLTSQPWVLARETNRRVLLSVAPSGSCTKRGGEGCG